MASPPLRQVRSIAIFVLIPLLLSAVACGSEAPPATADATAETNTDASNDATTDAAVDAGADAVSDTAADIDQPTDWKAAFDHVLPGDHVVDLRLTFAAGDWLKLLLDWQQTKKKVEYPAAFSFDAEQLPKIAVRLKGLNGLNLPEGPVNLQGKYPLKLDFNTFGGERFHGVDTVSLNTNGQDPSMMRERLSLRMYQAMGIPASRAAYALVQVDAKPVGLYNLVQVLDKRYLKERFGSAAGADDGNLYKCVYNGDNVCMMGWRGSNKADYYLTKCPEGFDECGFVLKTNEDDPAKNNYADLVELLKVLNDTPDIAFEAEFAKVFDIDGFLRVAAVAYAISNHDSYFGKGHNYYLYRHPGTGKFQYLPWDLDLTYGTTSCGGEITDPTCGGASSHLLVQRIMAVPAWKLKYLQYLREVIDNHLTVTKHQAWIAELDALLSPQLAKDPNGPDKTAYATDRDGLLEFVKQRRADILPRLEEAEGKGK